MDGLHNRSWQRFRYQLRAEYTVYVVFREIPRITAHNFPTGLRYFFGHKDNFHINSYIFLLWPMIHSIKLNYKIIENKY